MTADPNPIDPLVLSTAATEARRFMAQLTPREKLLTRPESCYALEVAQAWSRSPAGDAREYARRETRRRIVADLADPDRPADNRHVVREATAIAERRLRRTAAAIDRRFGNGIIDPLAAPGFAYDALIAWGRTESREPGSTRIWPYVDGTVRRLAAGEIDDALRVVDPAARALRRLEQRILDRLEGDQGLAFDERTRRQLAADRARAELLARGLPVKRAPFDAVGEGAEAGEDPLAVAIVHALRDRIRTLLHDPRYTDVDCLTWVCFETAGFRGRDIAWDRYEIAPHRGQQRLLALLRKLGRDLEDWAPSEPGNSC